jgi:hypothetical protein
MDPDSGYNAQQPATGSNMGRKLLALGVAIALLFTGLIFAITHSGGSSAKDTGGASSGKQGSVIMAYKLSDTSGISVYFNNKKATPTKGTTYNLDPDNYTLDVKKSGYETFSTKFSLAAGQTLAINVNLTASKESLAHIDGLSQIIFLPDGFAATATMTGDPQYFYNNTWAVIQAGTPDEPRLWLTVNYQAKNGGWILMADPAEAYDPTVAGQFPQDVQTYLNQFSAIVEGD